MSFLSVKTHWNFFLHVWGKLCPTSSTEWFCLILILSKAVVLSIIQNPLFILPCCKNIITKTGVSGAPFRGDSGVCCIFKPYKKLGEVYNLPLYLLLTLVLHTWQNMKTIIHKWKRISICMTLLTLLVVFSSTWQPISQ